MGSIKKRVSELEGKRIVKINNENDITTALGCVIQIKWYGHKLGHFSEKVNFEQLV